MITDIWLASSMDTHNMGLYGERAVSTVGSVACLAVSQVWLIL